MLIGHIRAHVKQGEKAKERADQAREKAEQHFISAGRYLFTLKLHYAPTWQHWEAILKAKVGLSTGRASELMQLADGRKDLQQIRDGKAESVARLRAGRSSLQAPCSEETEIPDELFERPLPASETERFPDDNSRRLIDALVQSSAATRSAAAEALINGSRQSQFEAVRNAVADLYTILMRMGRR